MGLDRLRIMGRLIAAGWPLRQALTINGAEQHTLVVEKR